jgi:hypothetical protein
VIRLILLIAFIVMVLILLQQVKNTPKANLKKLYWKFTLGGLGIGLVLLAATGRIHWVGAMVGATLPFLRQVAPLLIRFFPQIHQYHKSRSQETSSSGNQSHLTTQVLNMILDHDNNQLHGEVIQGPLKGSQLDHLEMEQLRSLLDYCYQQELDSANLLVSYLEHRFGQDWQDTSSSVSKSKLEIDEAYAILGLQTGASKEEVVKAHRSMIQKVHPDRGGSDYLAAQINEAKDRIINYLA